MPFVSSLHLYPMKSCRPVDVRSFSLDSLGPVGDRRWMVVANNKSRTFLSQRTHPRLALIDVKIIHRGTIELSLPNCSTIQASIQQASPVQKTATVLGSQVVAQDAGDAVSKWLSRFLEKDVRLVGIDRDYQRFTRNSDIDQTSFTDGYPLLILSRPSMDDLNKRLDFPIGISRFRPNIVVDGCDPFDEDCWSHIKIGDCLLRASGPCTRCVITTLDPQTGQGHGKEPLHALAQYRKTEKGVIFGQNFTNESKSGQIEIGMEIQIL